MSATVDLTALAGAQTPGLERSLDKPRTLWGDTWQQFRKHTLAVICLVMLLLITLGSIFGPIMLPYDPEQIDFESKSQAPSLSHPMGTDELGRDQLVRVLDGGRISLAVAAISVVMAMTLGTLVGSTAGYLGGAVDNVLMRIVDVFYSMPGLFVVILLLTVLGPGFWTIAIAIGVLRWMGTARLVRASFLSLKEAEFVEAARTIGVRGPIIVTRHLLPNALSPIIVAATLGMAGAILTESALSFLGLGFQPPQATWGRLLEEASNVVINKGHWWRGLFPGLMIFLVVLSVNFIGDGLRDAVDPRRRQR